MKDVIGQPMFTNQILLENEEVQCATCKDGNVGLRWSGWFDKYVNFNGHQGAYVHYGCLSEQRKAELAAEHPQH